jgi:hypothetical protein
MDQVTLAPRALIDWLATSPITKRALVVAFHRLVRMTIHIFFRQLWHLVLHEITRVMLRIPNSTKITTGKGGQLRHRKSQGGALSEQWTQLFRYHWLMER